MKGIQRKAAILVTAAAVTAASITGCGKLNASDVVATIDGTELTLGVANFCARYQQAEYETYYASMLGGADQMWSTEVSSGTTYEDNVKAGVLSSLEQMIILEDHMEDYNVTLTDEEKGAIKEAAAKFVSENDDSQKETVTGDEASVERFLTLTTIQQKMYNAIIADVDTNVTDEEAAQRAMQYVSYSFAAKDGDGNSTTLTDDEKATLKAGAEAFAAGAKNEDDFEAYAEKSGQTANKATFDKASTSPAQEVIAAVDALEVGGTTGVIETENGYYVARVTSDLDREATDSKKETIVSQRKQDRFNETYDKWKEEAEIKENKRVWKKVAFDKQGVTIKDTASENTDNTEK